MGGVIRGNGVFCSIIRKGSFSYDNIFFTRPAFGDQYESLFFMLNIFMTKGEWTLVEVHYLAPRCLHPCSGVFGEWSIIFTITKNLSLSQLNVYVPHCTTYPKFYYVTLNGKR